MKRFVCFLVAFAVCGMPLFSQNKNFNKGNIMKFELKPLPYAHTALEPWIDATTVALHHDKHQATYVNNLNNALAKVPDFEFDGGLIGLIRNLSKVPESVAVAVKNNAGGVFNHEFYWGGLSGEASVASRDFAEAIERTFGSMENFRRDFSERGAAVFGSGYVWLCADRKGNLRILTSANQDNPMSDAELGKVWVPIFCVDVWEHSYYLKYQNVRAEYLKNIWNIVDWEKVSERFERVVAGGDVLM